MNSNYSLALFFVATLASLLPTSANAQTIVSHYQMFPEASGFASPAVDAPLTFEQANAYSSPSMYSQANSYLQPMTYSQADTYSPQQTHWQANMYFPPLVHSQQNAYSQPQLYTQPYSPPIDLFVGGQVNGVHSSTPAPPVDFATPQLPVPSPPVHALPSVQPAKVACHT